MRRRAKDFLALTRPRVVLMVLVTTLVGYSLGSRGAVEYVLLLKTLLCMALAAGGTAALNQYLEREGDARMERTRLRPLPAGRLRPAEALAFGTAMTASGIGYITLAAGLLSGLLTAITVASYLFAYTPMKRRSPLSTIVGAIPGALPPMIGWASARGGVGPESWVLFVIVFLWQIPHALAIARLYRDDYARASIKFLPVVDRERGSLGRAIISHCSALLLVGLFPALMGMTGRAYFFGALVIGLVFLVCGIRLAIASSAAAARRLLFASLVYLPVLFALMVFDRLPPSP